MVLGGEAVATADSSPSVIKRNSKLRLYLPITEKLHYQILDYRSPRTSHSRNTCQSPEGVKS
jgi:hypothetical protein